jgi:uncharacterized protein YxjI
MKISQNKIVVKQELEPIEIFTGFETKNKYSVCDESGKKLCYAFEESGFLGRQFLGRNRPLKINMIDNNKAVQLTAERPFFFFFANYKINDGTGNTIATVKQKFNIARSRFDVYCADGNLVFTCANKPFHWWTFDVTSNGNKVGQILKKWSGGGKEFFTDADNFLVDFGNMSDDVSKNIMLALALVIDTTIFERKK